MLAPQEIRAATRLGVGFSIWLFVACQLFGQSDVTDVPQTDVPQNTKLNWQVQATGTKVSLRGLSVVDSKTLWACGAGSTVIRSLDGGTNWTNCNPNFGELEFRSITGFDDHTACIASAGTPAVILRTSDGGRNWVEVFKHQSPAAFFDGLRFWDGHRGIAFSDPVDGRILVVLTNDGGETWQAIEDDGIPVSRENEGGFAASNSSLCVGPAGRAWIGTGGTVAEYSRIYSSIDFGRKWAAQACPIPSATSQGVFSITANAETTLLIAAGGDYRPAAKSELTVAVSEDAGKTWRPALQPPHDFVSAVCTVDVNRHAKPIFIAAGPTGSYLSEDADHWLQFSEVGFHAMETIPESVVFAVGSEGRFGKLKLP